MQQTVIARLLPAALLALTSGAVSGAGFQLLEQNASGIGNAYAGSAAVAENASTIYFNPAGMTRLQAREVSMGFSAVRPSFEFKDKGSAFLDAPFSIPASGKTKSDAGGWAIIPNGYLAWALTDDVHVGVGLGAPFGLMTDYSDNWVGRAQSITFDIKTYNINPSVAWRVNELVSLGAGVSWQRLDAEYERAATVLPDALTGIPGLSASEAKLEADSDAWGWNVGALFTLSPATRVGLSYRSRIEHTLKGDLKLSGPNAFANAALTSKARAKVELPDTFILSAVHELDNRWELLGDVSWTGWSSIKEVDIVRTSGPLAGATAQTLHADFRDSWRVALGANYRLNDAWKLKFGVAYDQTPVKDKERRLVALPDNDRTWFSVGGQWKATRTSVVDLGAAYLYVPKTKINNDQTAEGRGRVTGDYTSSVWILGAQYSLAF